MKLIDGKIHIEFDEMVSAICRAENKPVEKIEKYLWNANNKKNRSLPFIKDELDKRRVLYIYEELSKHFRDIVYQCYGDPYEYIARQPIKRLVEKDLEAHSFFLAYRYNNNCSLSSEHVEAYTKAASWLNMIGRLKEDYRFVKKELGLTMDSFWKNVCDLIISEKVKLPASYRRLVVNEDSALKKYKAEGYKSLISSHFGNNNASKVYNEHVSGNLLLELLAHPNQYDDVYISERYNAFATSTGLKTITSAAVGVWRREKEHLILMQREGNSAFNEKYIRSIPGKRPSAPLYLVEHDDNHLDFLFCDEDDKGSSKYFHRYKAIVVTDSYNDLVLGYAYSENLTIEVMYAAYANAMHYIHHLTNGWYLPHEVKGDRWQMKSLKPFYEKLGKTYETPVGSKHRGYIEQFFGSKHWKLAQQLSSNGNWSGHNMTAKYRGVNNEVLDSNMKNRPQIGHEAFAQIEGFFYRLRHLPQDNGLSKEQEWLNAFNQLPADKKRPISEEQLLYTIGINHRPKNGRLPRISNEGLSLQIANTEYLYAIPSELRMQYTGTAVNVLYDPFDMNRILVADNDKLRLVAYSQERVSKAMQDHYEGSRTYLNSMLAEKMEDVKTVVAARDVRQASLVTHGIDVEALLSSNMIVKEIKQVAELSYTQQHKNDDNDTEWQQLQVDYLNSKVNTNDFLNS